jgi:hypothetical protein
VNRVKNKIILSRQTQLEQYKAKYETVLNWLCIQFDGKEEFWSKLEKDSEKNKLDMCEYRLCQIVHENVHETFFQIKG